MSGPTAISTPNQSDLFTRLLLVAGAVRLCQSDDGAQAGLRALAESLPEKSIVIRSLSPGDRILDLLHSTGLGAKLATVHLAFDAEESPRGLAAGLDAYQRVPITLNLTEPLVDLFLEAVEDCQSDYLNLTLNFLALSGESVSRVLASEALSKWGATCFNPAAARADAMAIACAGRLMLCVDDAGKVYGCQAMMQTGLGALGNIWDLDGLTEVIAQSPLSQWQAQGPELDAGSLERAAGDVCVAHMHSLARLFQAAA